MPVNQEIIHTQPSSVYKETIAFKLLPDSNTDGDNSFDLRFVKVYECYPPVFNTPVKSKPEWHYLFGSHNVVVQEIEDNISPDSVPIIIVKADTPEDIGFFLAHQNYLKQLGMEVPYLGSRVTYSNTPITGRGT